MKSIFILTLVFWNTTALFGSSNAEKVFTNMYNNNVWGGDDGFFSGGGSTLEEGGPFIEYVQNVLDTYDIKSVVDVGCGDWVLANEIDWGNRIYLGVDVVPELIERNKQLYSSENIRFLHVDAAIEHLPKGDLLICKDVLQHLSFNDINHILEEMKKFKYVIFVNDIDMNMSTNQNVATGGYRPLDLSKKPFFLKRQKHIVTYQSGGFLKQMFLIKPNSIKYTDRVSKFGISSCAKIPADQRS